MSTSEAAIKLRKLSQRYVYTSIQLHEAVGRKAGMSGTDHKYLGFLLQRGAMTAGELATITGLTTGAITGLIDRFEAKKLVKRQFDTADRRRIIIVPDTKRITNLLQPLYKKFQDKTDKLMASFSDAELKILEQYFVRALELMTATSEELTAGK